MISAKTVQRQEAIAVIIPVKEPSQLMPVNRVVGRIQVQDQFLGRIRMLGQKGFDENILQALKGSRDLLVAAVLARPRRREFQSVESTLPRERLATIGRIAPLKPLGIGLAASHREERIGPLQIVIVEIFIPQT